MISLCLSNSQIINNLKITPTIKLQVMSQWSRMVIQPWGKPVGATGFGTTTYSSEINLCTKRLRYRKIWEDRWTVTTISGNIGGKRGRSRGDRRKSTIDYMISSLDKPCIKWISRLMKSMEMSNNISQIITTLTNIKMRLFNISIKDKPQICNRTIILLQ